MYLIIGAGRTGRAVLDYCISQKIPRVIFDDQNIALSSSQDPDTIYTNSQSDLNNLFYKIKKVITSPGIKPSHPVVLLALSKKIPVISEIELLAEIFKLNNIFNNILGITGTNGKSTVTVLVGAMLQDAGYQVGVGGNLGTTALELYQSKKYDNYVLELSSYQLLNTFSLELNIACILNISPDHLSYHGNFKNYVAAKHRIYHHAKIAIYNRSDPLTYPTYLNDFKNPKYTFGLDQPKNEHDFGFIQHNNNIYLAKGDNKLVNCKEFNLIGQYNWLNIAAACTIAWTFGLSTDNIIKIALAFEALEHRCKLVDSIDGVDFYNDSKATNVESTYAAISGLGILGKKIILIAGGILESTNLEVLLPIIAKYVKSVILIGQDAQKINKIILENLPNFTTFQCQNLSNAVECAHLISNPEDVVLFSPACKSFDMFENYAHRGQKFINAVINRSKFSNN